MLEMPIFLLKKTKKGFAYARKLKLGKSNQHLFMFLLYLVFWLMNIYYSFYTMT